MARESPHTKVMPLKIISAVLFSVGTVIYEYYYEIS